MSDPQPVAAHVADLRASLAAARPAFPLNGTDTSETVAADMEEMRAAYVSDRWERVCPRRFLGVSMEWVQAEHGADTHDRLVEWGETDPATNLVLLGPVGTGKSGTSLAACKAGQLTRNEGLMFLPVSELLDQLRPGGPEGALERLTHAPRLIIDDLGTERVTDWTAERMGVLINRRWLEERPTIATSNLPATRAGAPKGYDGLTLEEAIGPRSFSRLVGGALVLELGGDDRRRRG